MYFEEVPYWCTKGERVDHVVQSWLSHEPVGCTDIFMQELTLVYSAVQCTWDKQFNLGTELSASFAPWLPDQCVYPSCNALHCYVWDVLPWCALTEADIHFYGHERYRYTRYIYIYVYRYQYASQEIELTSSTLTHPAHPPHGSILGSIWRRSSISWKWGWSDADYFGKYSRQEEAFCWILLSIEHLPFRPLFNFQHSFACSVFFELWLQLPLCYIYVFVAISLVPLYPSSQELKAGFPTTRAILEAAACMNQD